MFGKSYVEDITKLYNEAVNYDKLKTEFFSNITHELKTPIAVILSAIQLMEQMRVSQDFGETSSSKHLKTIKQNCYRLLRLVNNILDVTRADSAYTRLNPINSNIVNLVEEITQSVGPFAEQKGIKIEFASQVEEIITAVDVDKVERIVLNLLSNAIKFTDSGGIISVNVSEKNNKVLLSVKDTGTGIPKNMHSAIFERFRQANNSLSKDSQGSGIGLSLVKTFVELHNGAISLNSEVNKGSEFIIELPIRLCQESTSQMVEKTNDYQNKIIQAVTVEFSDIYTSVP
jgi:two-component system, cell cycle sensor histidine kinase PleC